MGTGIGYRAKHFTGENILNYNILYESLFSKQQVVPHIALNITCSTVYYYPACIHRSKVIGSVILVVHANELSMVVHYCGNNRAVHVGYVLYGALIM